MAKVNFEKGFFDKPSLLIVSGQLCAETYAYALSDVYTFGPTFRAENNNTSPHLAEFWMIEPEMALASLDDAMGNAEASLNTQLPQLWKKNADLIFLIGLCKKDC